MKYILPIKLNEQVEKDVAMYCSYYGIKNWSLNERGLVDVGDNVNLFGKKLSRLPLQFGKVSGEFTCKRNGLTTLIGCPESVGYGFDCSQNKLSSLEFGSKYVGAGYNCSQNRLTTLKGAPESINEVGFDCSVNNITSLEYCPKYINGSLTIQYNQLTSLQYGPEEVTGLVHVSPIPKLGYNPLPNLPQKYHTQKYLQFIIHEQSDWNLYRKDGYIYSERLKQMIEWGKEQGKI